MNAPLSWIKKTLEFYVDYTKPNKNELLEKILLGLPFHGFLAQKGKEGKMSILDGSSYSSLVSNGQVSSLNWDKVECEHLIEIEGEQPATAIYPTKKFIKERLDFCKTNKMGGVAIWDMAQGLESFLDEF